MTRCRFWLAKLACLVLPCVVLAQAEEREAAVLFKDGFYVKGRVGEKRDFIVDPASGRSIPVAAAGGFIYIDDFVRRIHFDPSQVQDVIPLSPAELQGRIVLKRYPYFARSKVILPGWAFEKVSPWNAKWERTLLVNTNYGKKYMDMNQRILAMTPYATQVLTVGYNWDLCYMTQELGPELTRNLVYNYYDSLKDAKTDKSKDSKPSKDSKELKETKAEPEQGALAEPQKLLQVSKFLYQAGWPEAAERELTELIKEHPQETKQAEEMLQAVREEIAGNFVEEIERASQLGQHQTVHERLAVYEKKGVERFASEKHRLALQDVRTKYDNVATQLAEVKQLLKALVALVPEEERTVWAGAAMSLVDELNLDTLPRLETFIAFGQQHQRELKAQQTPAQTTEQVLALAVTGWLQGNQAAEPDVKTAQKLLVARKFLMEYLKRDSPVARNLLLAEFMGQNDLPADVVARLVRLVPPAHAQEKIDKEPMEFTVEIPETDAFKYLVQLPPDYSHHRAHPVLFLLHSAREQAETLVQRWKEQAARYGFILVAPYWSKGLRATYEFSTAEHNSVLDVLRDLRRRFQVDSDRVFLFGWEQGATMAFDVGLSHPDVFAGVLPMNGAVMGFPARYWSNGQYLPFYVVEGDRNGGNPKAARGLFKEWIRCHYASIYVEYKGRGSEWYAAELPQMMNWMSRKKRMHPQRQLGRHHTGAGSGEEFKTMRVTDNRFYWLSTDAINAVHINDYPKFSLRTLPATLQADLGVGNELEKKGANIWSQFNIRTSGVKQVTLWLEGGLIDFTRPVRIRVNGDQVGSDRVIQPHLPTMLEELAATGDRQRLMFARVDIKLR